MNVKVLTFFAFCTIAFYMFFLHDSSNLDTFTISETKKAPTHPTNSETQKAPTQSTNSETQKAPTQSTKARKAPTQSKQCDPDIAPFYIYELPSRFTEPLLHNCSTMSWSNLCPYFENQGMGQSFNKSNWHNTYQFNAEMLFHARAINHPCRTHDPSSALVFYIPFYISLYIHAFSFEYDMTRRAALWLDLIDHVSRLPTFQRHGGHDHFLVSGLMMWDFLYPPAREGYEPSGINEFLNFPEFSNVSTLIIERNPKSKHQFGIPYPSYFHPKLKSEMTSWQDEVRRSKRTHLFSFVGGARNKEHGSAIYRSAVINQCNQTESCNLVLCNFWGAVWDAVDEILGAMKRAHFCLQPPGDTFTRRSVFDSILTGCVPVFFTDKTAYLQYEWYIPKRREDWSVLIGPDQLDRIEEVLSQIPQKEVERMREVVIEMIPRVTYAHPTASGFPDAVDTALVELTKQVRHIKDGVGAN